MGNPSSPLTHTTFSVSEIARTLYEQAFEAAGISTYGIADQQQPAFGKRCLSSNWATSDSGRQYLLQGQAPDADSKGMTGPTLGVYPCPTTDFLRAAGLVPNSRQDLLVYDLHFLAFPKAAWSIALALSDEGHENIVEALSTLQRFSSTVLEVFQTLSSRH
ncbi:hypothetical protein P389DRAFT_193687 [Cystobasidium minutum MCA 4210]|uniref:uncharacterized protein n=1 Tax=Cystobasidium minutum MCA 4210 TaxID=1397322 RepID=UPI0034CEEC26|eukprot:jgi/Rhomi1/193687/gm1.1901_g